MLCISTPLRISTVVLLLAALHPVRVQAWGADGHRLVATVAESQLSPSARAEATRLLALEPGSTMASISTWADETRAPTTAAWHYVNFTRDGDCAYDVASLCADGQCVVGAIDQQVAILASTASDTERLQALKYVVHFVADVHQPLHAGFADDKGGNLYQLQAFGRGTNLHAVWDSGLVKNWPGGLPALQAAVAADASPADGTPTTWAEESCRAVGQTGFYPPTHRLDEDYPRQWGPTLVQRLAQASRRLAAVINVSLGAR